MDSQQHLQKAKISARNMLIVATLCLEFIFLLLIFITYNFFAPMIFLAMVLLSILAPIAAMHDWQKEIRKAEEFEVQIRPYSLPYSPKVNMSGAQLVFKSDRLCSTIKHQENREVLYSDIKTAEVTWTGAYILKLTRISGKFSLSLNLSLCDKEDWPNIIDAIVTCAPNVTLNNLANEIWNRNVPYF